MFSFSADWWTITIGGFVIVAGIVYPLCKHIVFPILWKMITIPLRHFIDCHRVGKIGIAYTLLAFGAVFWFSMITIVLLLIWK